MAGTLHPNPRIRGMKDFPIGSVLEAKLRLPVYVHNNCSIIAQSEFRYGDLGGGDSMFMFLLRSGVNREQGKQHLVRLALF